MLQMFEWQAGSGLLASTGFFEMVSSADLVGKMILIALLGGSVWVWTVMVSKYRELREAQILSDRFLEKYRKVQHPLIVEDRGSSHLPSSPLRAVYRQFVVALEAVLEVQGVEVSDFHDPEALRQIRLSDRQIDSVRNAAERAVAEQALVLETNMTMLATASSLAPFCGLFGTVWGVMMAFAQMTGSGSALLSEVAPGISSALVTTVVGLFVAIPSLYGYNLLSERIRRLTVTMDNFGQEITGDLERMHRA